MAETLHGDEGQSPGGEAEAGQSGEIPVRSTHSGGLPEHRPANILVCSMLIVEDSHAEAF